jgi:hypothetical protein
VFTLPDILNRLTVYQPKAVYNSFFEAAWKTVACFSKDPRHLGTKAGMTTILHIPIRLATGQAMGTDAVATSPSSLHRSGRGTGQIGKVEGCQKEREVSLSGQSDGQGLSGKVCAGTQVQNSP